jgi:hypothetical protein
MPFAMTLSGPRGPHCELAKKAGKNGVRPCVCTDSRGRKKFAKLEKCDVSKTSRRRR